jgi:hypothetical protein
MIEEKSWPKQKPTNKAVEGLSLKENPCERVTKIRAREMMATWR